MKKINFLAISIFLFSVIFGFVASKETLVGTWKITYPSGDQVTIVFRDNGTIRAEIPSEHFTVEGKYKVKGDMVYVMDSTCGTGYWSKYKSRFISNDSVYSEAIEDSCMGRKSTIDKQTLVRVKN
ncbi:MAG TPA: hypothetical protein VFE04_05035 [Puia sp.]|jgi:hypothetical protein|nr:hypothetical protein [Puia sp.]